MREEESLLTLDKMSVARTIHLLLLGFHMCQATFTTQRSLLADAREAVSAVLMETSQADCSVILLIDGTSPPYTFFKLFNQSQFFAGVFEVVADSQDANVTQDQISQVVDLARKVRKSSWCSSVLLVSEDPSFVSSFAHWSLKGRLLVWSTRLLLLTRLPLQHLNHILAKHWTFSMMNAMVFNLNDVTSEPRWSVYTHLPYSEEGPQTVRLASWINGSPFKLQMHKFFPEKFLNFHGARVNVTNLPYAPHWMESVQKLPDGSLVKKYSGIDHILLNTIADTYNFSFFILHSDTWDDVTERVEERVSLMVSQYFNVLPQRLERFDFSFTYEFSSIDICAAKPRLRPQWQSLYHPLSHGVWLSLLLTLLVVPLSLYLLNMVASMYYLAEVMSAETAYQMVVATFFSQNLTRKLPRSNASRVLVTAWLIFAFIIGTAYQGNLTASLTLPKYPSRAETVEEFVNTFSTITMPPWGNVWIEYFRQSDSPVFKALAEQIELIPTVRGGLQRALDGQEAHVASRSNMGVMIARHFSRPDGSTQLYIGRESIFPGLSAWPIPHDAPYRPQLDRIMVAVVEAGVYEKWRSDTVAEVRRESREKQQQQQQQQQQESEEKEELQSEGSLAPLNLVHMQGPLLLLLLGHFVAVLIFLAEARKSILSLSVVIE